MKQKVLYLFLSLMLMSISVSAQTGGGDGLRAWLSTAQAKSHCPEQLSLSRS